jgi:hypothetical protein
MNMIWKVIKVTGAFVVAVGVIFWVINSTRPQSYSGTDLDFVVGGGAVLVTNSSDQSIPAQFMGTGSRNFRVSSDIEGVSGNSTREGTGSSATQLFEFELPARTSEFLITLGTNVTFVATAPFELEAIANPMTADSSRTAVIVAVVVVLGALFYASHVVEHRWIRVLRGQSVEPVVASPAPVAVSAQGRAARAFGDNRSNSGD